MKIFVEKSNFAGELSLFQGIFEKKTLMDILQNIMLTALENGVLEMIATDLEIGLSSSFKVDVKEPGTFTVNGKDFYDLMSKMPEGNVEISENNNLQIIINNETKTSKYKLLGLQSSDYPQLPTSNFSQSIKIPLDKLRSMINKNYYIISPEMKFNLGGALFNINDDEFEMAATDGHRLSYTYYKNESTVSEPSGFIISRKTLLELLKIGERGDLDFSYDKNNLFFKYQNRILSSRIIDQKFPNYKTVIPEETQFQAILKSEDLLDTLRRVLIFKTRNNGVVFKFSNNKLILERTTPEKGEAHEELHIDYSGNNIEVAFNGNFIIDFLTHIDSDEIQIEMNDSDSSFVFKSRKDEDIHFIYVVMPLNI
ncbi:MAG: DNA polymerase III subunit beta [Candidatus Aminicenantes bacterium]|nr:DNA polymerase III subunit beta [Candidatus Aminicenantes bacterium]